MAGAFRPRTHLAPRCWRFCATHCPAQAFEVFILPLSRLFWASAGARQPLSPSASISASRPMFASRRLGVSGPALAQRCGAAPALHVRPSNGQWPSHSRPADRPERQLRQRKRRAPDRQAAASTGCRPGHHLRGVELGQGRRTRRLDRAVAGRGEALLWGPANAEIAAQGENENHFFRACRALGACAAKGIAGP
jgi:hypothetical protein